MDKNNNKQTSRIQSTRGTERTCRPRRAQRRPATDAEAAAAAPRPGARRRRVASIRRSEWRRRQGARARARAGPLWADGGISSRRSSRRFSLPPIPLLLAVLCVGVWEWGSGAVCLCTLRAGVRESIDGWIDRLMDGWVDGRRALARDSGIRSEHGAED